MTDYTKHYLVAEMVHGALLPLLRSKGVPVVEWKHLMQSEKDEKAQAVLQLASTGIVEKHPETQEETIFCGLVMTMYPIEAMSLSPEGEERVNEELERLTAESTPVAGELGGTVAEDPKGTPIK